MKKETLALSAIALFFISFVLGAIAKDSLYAKAAQSDGPSFADCEREINSMLELTSTLTLLDSPSIIFTGQQTQTFSSAAAFAGGGTTFARCIYVDGAIDKVSVLKNPGEVHNLTLTAYMLGSD